MRPVGWPSRITAPSMGTRWQDGKKRGEDGVGDGDEREDRISQDGVECVGWRANVSASDDEMLVES